MGVGKMYWAGVRFVVYALPAEELAVLAGPDFLVPCRNLFARDTAAVPSWNQCWLTRRGWCMWVWNKAAT
jgi:hypothetical protein